MHRWSRWVRNDDGSAALEFIAVGVILLVPLVMLLFQAPLLEHPAWLALILVAGTIGFAAVGTLFAAMLVRVRSRDVPAWTDPARLREIWWPNAPESASIPTVAPLPFAACPTP